MTIQKKAMTNGMKHKTIADFLAQMGVRKVKDANFAPIWNELVSAMYSVMDVKILDLDDLGQMLNLWLAGMNPSSFWSQGRTKDGEGADKAQQFLGAFTDRAATVWNDLWGGDKPTDKAQESAIITTLRRMKTVLRQRVQDELRDDTKRTRNQVSIGGGETEQEQAYQTQMEGEITRSVSVGQTFNMNSWDEVSAAARKDDKVGAAVAKIENLFSSNNLAMARAVVDIAHESQRNTDAFELKLFQIVMGVGDYETTVKTDFGDITINEKLLVSKPTAIKKKNWRGAMSDYLVVLTYPELRNLMVLPKSVKVIPEDFNDLATVSGITRPLASGYLSLPTELMLSKTEILRNPDAAAMMQGFNYRSPKCPIQFQNDKYAVLAADYKKIRDAVAQAISQKWEQGKKGRKPSFWKAGMNSIVRTVEILPDSKDPSSWVVADPVPATATAATKKFVAKFQEDLKNILIELDEAHGWYELRNKRFAKKKEAKLHRLASKIAYRWIQSHLK